MTVFCFVKSDFELYLKQNRKDCNNERIGSFFVDCRASVFKKVNVCTKFVQTWCKISSILESR